MSDVLSKLPRLLYNDKSLFILKYGTSVDFDLSMHKPVYKDNAYIDYLGKNNRRFSYTLAFREGVKNYSFLYSKTFPEFVKDIESGKRGVLRDPIFGEFDVFPMRYSIDADPTKRNGVDIDVEFVHAPKIKDGELPSISPKTIADVRSTALDLQATALDIPTLPTDVLNAILSVVNGILNLADTATVAVLLVVGKLESANFALYKIAKSIERLTDPQAWVLLRAVNALIDTINLVEGLFKGGELYGVYIVPQPITLLRLAQSLNMSIQDLFKLNPGIKQMVPQNTQVLYVRS
jgi:hypothetical protein